MEKGKHSSIAVRSANCLATMEIIMPVPQKVGNSSTLGPIYISLWHIPKGYSILPQGQVLNHLHCGYIQNIQKLEKNLDIPQQKNG